MELSILEFELAQEVVFHIPVVFLYDSDTLLGKHAWIFVIACKDDEFGAFFVYKGLELHVPSSENVTHQVVDDVVDEDGGLEFEGCTVEIE